MSGFASQQIIFHAFWKMSQPTLSSSGIGGPAGLGTGAPSAMASSFLADLPVRNPDSFSTITKSVKKMPVQLSFDNDDVKVIKNVKESLLIQYLERHYELQPGSDNTPAYRAKAAREEERKKSHKRKEEATPASRGDDSDDEQPSTSKTRRVQPAEGSRH
ncbi:hypothetical protein PRIPAC_84101 [Pristionchus pacificus]|uniref:Uncharacterized protein n=1 Tax=Pristionchus pacificus TaxID=54126 RepID=A0A2A6BM54_PRIPA|nr:hypothetical protein PRIPAC_84101 [Pristionchus pacificus]|eukprot:PDM66989.1 hypothetical protein PRIPAC_48406 [Pristionchus pacificus]